MGGMAVGAIKMEIKMVVVGGMATVAAAAYIVGGHVAIYLVAGAFTMAERPAPGHPPQRRSNVSAANRPFPALTDPVALSHMMSPSSWIYVSPRKTCVGRRIKSHKGRAPRRPAALPLAHEPALGEVETAVMREVLSRAGEAIRRTTWLVDQRIARGWA